MAEGLVVAFLVASGALLVAFLAFGAGRFYVRLLVPFLGFGTLALASVGIGRLSEAQCGDLLELVGQRGSGGGFLTLHCLGLTLLVGAAFVAALDVACVVGLLLRSAPRDTRARGDG